MSSPDPAGRLLLQLAERDAAAVGKMAPDPEFADEIFGFHAQQALEKGAKAMLAAKGIAFARSHDLEPLFTQLADAGLIQFSEFEDLLDLTDFAVFYRYQPFDTLGGRLDRADVAARVAAFVRSAAELWDAG